MKFGFLCAAAMLAAMGMGAMTGAVAGERQVVVSYADLNLNNQAGRDVLMRQINLAARRICGPAPIPAERLHFGERYDRCIKDTVDRAIASLPGTVIAQLNGVTAYREATAKAPVSQLGVAH